MHSRISRNSILLWSTVALVIGIAFLQSKQYSLMISGMLSLVLLIVAYWILPRYRSVSFFLLLAPSAIVAEIFSGLFMIGGNYWHSFIPIILIVALVGVILAWRFPRYELVALPIVVGLYAAAMQITATSGLWVQMAVAFTLAVISIGALATARRLSM